MESSLKGKNILVGVTGGIAAYKTATIVRELKKRGADVKVVMTPLAKQFITPLTMATLSQHPILVDFFNPENGEWFTLSMTFDVQNQTYNLYYNGEKLNSTPHNFS